MKHVNIDTAITTNTMITAHKDRHLQPIHL